MVLDPLIGRRLKLGIEALKSNCLFFQLQRKLIKGDVAVVDNRRILHARREFDSTSGKLTFERLIVREMNFCQLYVLLNVPVQKENIASKMARNYLANNSSDFDENTSN